MRVKISAILLALGLCALSISTSFAVQPVHWKTSGVQGWQKTDRDSIGITGEGRVVLNRGHSRISGFEGLTVWDILETGGRTFVATGDQGTLYQITSGGKAEKVLSILQPEITAMGTNQRGDLFLGGAPDGAIYKVSGKEANLFVDLPENYIWAILPWGSNDLMVATGNAGKLYRVKSNGEASLFVDTEASHISGLIPLEGGELLATTEGPGRLLKINARGDIEVLYEAGQPEVRSPCRDEDGAIYFVVNPAKADKVRGQVMRLSPTGAVEKLWEALSGYAYDLHIDAQQNLWVSTGGGKDSGTVVRIQVDAPDQWTEVVRLPEPQITSMSMSGGVPVWVGTGGLGRVYALEASEAPQGVVHSTIEDAGSNARWGSLSLAPGPSPNSVRAFTRSGNTRDPDKTWSEWQRVPLEGIRGLVPSPAARFLQWKLELGSAASEVSEVDVVYLPANRPPRIQNLSVSELGAPLERGLDRASLNPVGQSLPGGLRIEFQPGAGNGRNDRESANDAEASWVRRFRSVTWKGTDPNKDKLKYDLSLKASGESRWNAVARDLTGPPWVWDSATVPDGWYQVQVEANDGEENQSEQTLRARRSSEPFLVDNTPPEFSSLNFEGNQITGTVSDKMSTIKLIEYSLDGETWRRVFPEDGIPDMSRESFKIEVPTSLESGNYTLVVRAFDVAGNLGAGRLEFRKR